MKSNIFFFFILLPTILFSQEEKPSKWAINGYLKDLQTVQIINLPSLGQEAVLQDNLLHNRLNIKYFANEAWTFKVDFRNRLFWGDGIRLSGAEAYEAQLDLANDYFDLSVGKFDAKGIGVHSMIDRAYIEYSKDKWEIRLGRQRVNWGINTIWNPNDIFNAYSFTDFDYEERPGSDALRVKYYPNYSSSIEVASNVFDDIDEAVIAGLWTFNKWNYDFQILAGIAEGDYALGGGWAGNIKNAGFKGELAYFIPFQDSLDEVFTTTFALDYVFDNSLYLSGGGLFTSSGSTTAGFSDLFTSQISAKALFPFKYATVVSAGYPISPLLNSNLAIIYSPSTINMLFLNPTLTYSIKENWDVDFVGQIVFAEDAEEYGSPLQALFLRVKWIY